MPLNPLQIVCLVAVCIAAVIDYRTHKIPNWLTFPGAILALVLQFMLHGGWWGLLWGAAGWFLGLTVSLISRLLPLLVRRYRQEAIGFGDIKLIALVGAYLGPHQVLFVFFFFCLFYGGLSVLKLARAIPWKKLWLLLSGSSSDYSLQSNEQDKIKATLSAGIPLAPAVALATICTLFFFPSGFGT